MRENFMKIRNSKSAVFGHVIIYLLVAVSCLVSYIVGTGTSLLVMIGALVVACIMAFLESQAFRGEIHFTERGKSSVIYHMVRLVCACSAFCLMTTEYEDYDGGCHCAVCCGSCFICSV